ncbi:DUF4097 family beta strand repeat-containing protein [Kribbella solani]|uniref:DUF4097 family beta strand repeat-containing protein n=1 Tax=Kribbella solani TaxID=236067 RepID=UPI0029B3614C|nr:DUF4097 family beta strand repeat-containing protein [Kribbella solani]MDX3000811.1 DUF4097 family beta strand repeat-containing protein [Kribbella solani]
MPGAVGGVRMTKGRVAMLLVGVVPLLAVLAGGGLVTVGMIRGKLPYNYSAAFTPGPAGVRIVADVATQVEASIDGQVHVTVDGTYAAAKPDVRIATTGQELVVQTYCPDIHCAVDLTVEVPAVKMVKAKLDGSSINVVGVTSPLAVDVKNGSVDIARVRSPNVSVDAQGGSVWMLFDNPPKQVSATSSDGSITVQVPRTENYTIDAVAAQGSTNVSVPSDMTASNHLYLRSSYGSITVQ